MSFNTLPAIFDAMVSAKTNADVQHILGELGDNSSIGSAEPFSQFRFGWRAFGDRSTNISSIGLGSKPGRSLTERITNAIDGLLEDRVPSHVPLPESVREAVSSWFGRPASSPNSGLYQWKNLNDIDRRISVVLHESGTESEATVDVLDNGIGIRAVDFPKTILSLQAENKIKKKYLIGAFGQGGSSTLAFADYTLIISRHKNQPDSIGFTLIRVLHLDNTYKEDCFAYLVISSDFDPLGCVPNIAVVPNTPLTLYANGNRLRLPVLSKGTLIRHFAYKLPNLSQTLSPATNNLWHHFQHLLFDALLPFRLIDLRPEDPAKHKNEIIKGSRNRLMLLAENMSEAIDDDESGSSCRLHRAMEFVAPHGSSTPCVGIEYWVVFNNRSIKGVQILRPHSNQLYVQKGFPIIFTLNGQNQGELGAKLIREAGLNLLSGYIIIHVDASGVDGKIRRELFATNREGLKDGPVLSSLTQIITGMLTDDAELAKIERELTERIAGKDTKQTKDEVKARVTKLLLDAGIHVSKRALINVPGDKDIDVEPPGKKASQGKWTKPAPLPTLPFPQVTRLEIVRPKPSLKIKSGEVVTLRIETDADERFDRENRLAIRSEPASLEVASKTALHGGRMSWRLRTAPNAVVGTTGKTIVSLTKNDGSQLTAELPFEICPTPPKNNKQEEGYIPDFNIVGITPEDNPEEWSQCGWSEGDSDPKELATVAYKTVSYQTGVIVFYSKIFGPYKAQEDALKSKPLVLPQFIEHYEIWVSYHAILQFKSPFPELDIDDADKDKIQEEDRSRVGSMIVKQALNLAELALKAIKADNERND